MLLSCPGYSPISFFYILCTRFDLPSICKHTLYKLLSHSFTSQSFLLQKRKIQVSLSSIMFWSYWDFVSTTSHLHFTSHYFILPTLYKLTILLLTLTNTINSIQKYRFPEVFRYFFFYFSFIRTLWHCSHHIWLICISPWYPLLPHSSYFWIQSLNSSFQN